MKLYPEIAALSAYDKHEHKDTDWFTVHIFKRSIFIKFKLDHTYDSTNITESHPQRDQADCTPMRWILLDVHTDYN